MATRPKRRMLDEYIRQDLLYMLRWNVFGALDDIEIATGPCDQPIVVPFFSHTLADESIATPPFSRIDEVYIGECVDRVDHHYPEEYRYKPPPPMTINNENGSPITLRQFVTQTHAYLNLHMEDLKEAKSFTYGELSKNKFNGCTRAYSDKPYLPTNIAFIFSKVWVMQIDQIVRFSTHVFAEGEDYRSMKEFWATRLRQANSQAVTRGTIT